MTFLITYRSGSEILTTEIEARDKAQALFYFYWKPGNKYCWITKITEQ